MKVSKIHGKGNCLLLDCYGADLNKLENLDLIKSVLECLPRKLGLNKISKPLVISYKAEDDKESGISGVILIAESHISIHTYPKKNFAVIDVFSCKEFNVEDTVEFLKKQFRFKKINQQLIVRQYEGN